MAWPEQTLRCRQCQNPIKVEWLISTTVCCERCGLIQPSTADDHAKRNPLDVVRKGHKRWVQAIRSSRQYIQNSRKGQLEAENLGAFKSDAVRRYVWGAGPLFLFCLVITGVGVIGGALPQEHPLREAGETYMGPLVAVLAVLTSLPVAYGVYRFVVSDRSGADNNDRLVCMGCASIRPNTLKQDIKVKKCSQCGQNRVPIDQLTNPTAAYLFKLEQNRLDWLYDFRRESIGAMTALWGSMEGLRSTFLLALFGLSCLVFGWLVAIAAAITQPDGWLAFPLMAVATAVAFPVYRLIRRQLTRRVTTRGQEIAKYCQGSSEDSPRATVDWMHRFWRGAYPQHYFSALDERFCVEMTVLGYPALADFSLGTIDTLPEEYAVNERERWLTVEQNFLEMLGGDGSAFVRVLVAADVPYKLSYSSEKLQPWVRLCATQVGPSSASINRSLHEQIRKLSDLGFEVEYQVGGLVASAQPSTVKQLITSDVQTTAALIRRVAKALVMMASVLEFRPTALRSASEAFGVAKRV